MIVLNNGANKLSCNGAMVQTNYGAMVQTNYGAMVQANYGAIKLWCNGANISWCNGARDRLSSGKLAHKRALPTRRLSAVASNLGLVTCEENIT